MREAEDPVAHSTSPSSAQASGKSREREQGEPAPHESQGEGRNKGRGEGEAEDGDGDEDEDMPRSPLQRMRTFGNGKQRRRRARERTGAGTGARRAHTHGIAAQNVMNMAFPPIEPLPTTLRDLHPYVLPLFLAWCSLAIFTSVPSVVLVLLNAWFGWWVWKTLRDGAEDRRWERESLRGEAAQKGYSDLQGLNPTSDGGGVDAHQPGRNDRRSGGAGLGHAGEGIKEGAEWLNALFEGVWSVMNPDLFASVGSTLEDVMQASIPGFVHAVKVVDIAQGSTPIRMTGVRVLPDREVGLLREQGLKAMRERREREKKRAGGVTAAQESEGARPSNAGESTKSQPGDDGDDADKELTEEEILARTRSGIASAEAQASNERPDEDNGGAYINMEISFVYRARPTSRAVASKSRNAHLLIHFYLGLRKIVTVPLPVWVEIRGMVGTVRVRVQLTPDPPFFKNVTFSLMGLPRVRVEVVPLHINTANVPLLSGFIQSSIDAAVGEYVAPSSMTMDVGEMLMGDNIKREVNALGVMVIYIHSATDLEKQDTRGSSDPYCTVS